MSQQSSAGALRSDTGKGKVSPMKALKNIHRYIKVEDGLVTVEWVALTAGMVVAAVAIGFIVMSNTYKEGNQVGGNIIGTTSGVYGTGGANLGS